MYNLVCKLLIVFAVSLISINSQPNQEQIDYLKHLLGVQKKIQSLLPTLKQSVVSIESIDGAGSGVIVSEDGLVLTAAHVIGERGKEMTVILSDGQRVNAISKGGSELSDAGMIQLEGNLKWKFAEIPEHGNTKANEWCFALGHPNGYDPKRGMVLRVGKILSTKDETIRTNCRLLGGDSGGPLFNLDGKIIGIHSRISRSPDDNFHITIESYKSNWEYFLSQEILTFSKLQRGGFLGVSCEKSSNGLRVLSVDPESAAEMAGITPMDELLRLDSIPLDTREKLTILVSSKQPDDTISLDILREGKEKKVQVLLGKRN